MKIPPTGLTPELLAHALFDEAVQETDGNMMEASVRVMRFLTESLVYMATISSCNDEIRRKELLKYLGEVIARAPAHPIKEMIAGARKDSP